MTVPRHPQDEPPVLAEHDGYPIYPMPVFAEVMQYPAVSR